MQAASLFGALLQRAYEMVTSCTCTNPKGCPSCVQHLNCSQYNAVLSKQSGEVVLRHVIQEEGRLLQLRAESAASIERAGGF